MNLIGLDQIFLVVLAVVLGIVFMFLEKREKKNGKDKDNY